MPEFVDWRNADDQEALVELALAAFGRGEAVVFPTESGYAIAAAADRAAALATLPADNLDWSLATPEPEALGPLGVLARRLVRRAWPGPALLEIEGDWSGARIAVTPGLHDRVFNGLTLAFRLPGHAAVLEVLYRLGRPLLMVEPAAASPADAGPAWIASLGERAALVLEDAPPRFDLLATRIRVSGENWSILRAGVYSDADVQRMAAWLLLFICTGNTCRSPMAEALAKMLLAKRAGRPVDELAAYGYLVMSAGVAASHGEPATPEAVEAVRRLGGDLSQHGSRPASAGLLEMADLVVALTQSHARLLTERFPEVRSRLLAADDVVDPFGTDQATYDECAGTILRHVRDLLAEVAP